MKIFYCTFTKISQFPQESAQHSSLVSTMAHVSLSLALAPSTHDANAFDIFSDGWRKTDRRKNDEILLSFSYVHSLVAVPHIYTYLRTHVAQRCKRVMRHGYVYAPSYICMRAAIEYKHFSSCVYDSPCPWHGLLLTPTPEHPTLYASFPSSDQSMGETKKEAKTTSTTHQRENAARTRTNAEPKSYYNTYLSVSLRLSEIWWGCAGVAPMSRGFRLVVCSAPHANERRMCNNHNNSGLGACVSV